MKTDSKRIAYLDILRIAGCLFVIAQHVIGSTITDVENHPYALAILTIFGTGAMLFLMASGALLLPVKCSTKEFLIKRMKVVVPPLLAWSVIYLIEKMLIGALSIKGALLHAALLPIVPTEWILWFLYAIIAIYLFMPIMSVMVQSLTKRKLEMLLVLWLLSGFAPYVSLLLQPDYVLRSPWGMSVTYLGYPVLGYYLHRYGLPFCKLSQVIIVMSLGVVLPLSAYAVQPMVNPCVNIQNVVFNDLGINTMCIAAWLFASLRGVHFDSRVIASLSDKTLGIYLMHILILRHLPYELTVNASAFTTILIFVVAAILTWILAKIPVLNKILGAR